MIPPKWGELTENLQQDFTQGGEIPVVDSWKDNTWQNDEFRTIVEGQFTEPFWLDCLKRAQNREQHYYFHTDTWLYEAIDKFPIEGKRVLIFGAASPFYEAVALTFGASSVVVSEYDDRPVMDNRISYVKPYSLQEKFDVAFSISSFEHSGLGRYGDPLDPDGDLNAMGEARSLLNEGGLLYLAIPIGQDIVFFNERRHYGRKRLSKLLEGWTIEAAFGMYENSLDTTHRGEYQPLYVLRNEETYTNGQ